MYQPQKQILCILFACCFLFAAQAQDVKQLVVQQLKSQNLDVASGDVVIYKDVVSRTSNVRHVYFQQAINRVPILNTESSIHIAQDGRLLYNSNNFVLNKVNAAPIASKENLQPEIALKEIIKDLGYKSLKPLEIIEKSNTNDPYEVHFDHGGIFEREVRMYYRYTLWEGRLTPIWQANVFEKDYEHYWDVWYHITENRVIKKEDLVTLCDLAEDRPANYHENLYDIPNYKAREEGDAAFCENCYEVFKLPIESPFYGNRNISEYENFPIGSPYGWHDTNGIEGPDSHVTEGNNVTAIEADDNYGYQPSGGSELDFSGFAFDTQYTQENQFEDAAITNIFYTCNTVHDIYYTYGFDERSGNFQYNNYGQGGMWGDPLLAHTQSSIRPCNAFMVTPRDGVSPTLVMGKCNTRDGSYDNLVLVHEYSHGLSARLTIGDGNLSYKESPTEGWSDWLAMMLTMQAEDTPLTPRTIGTYLRGQSIDGPGVRAYPYTMDTDLNPLTFASLEEGMSIHAVGTVWATILWEITWRLIEEYGFDPNIYSFTGDINQDAGNIMALAVVIEGFRYTGSIGGFVNARDGILIAAESIYGPEMTCLLWEAFTTRGMGVFADSGGPFVLGDEFPSFDFEELEPRFDLELEGICNTSEELRFLTGGFPRGGVYSGPGISDNGNGTNFSFDPVEAGVGTHEIVYSFSESPCFPASQETVEIVVSEDIEPPFIDCPEEIMITYATGDGYSIPDYFFRLFVQDNCSNSLLARETQTPPPGTILTEGSVLVTLEAEDLAGNVAICSFNLILNPPTESDDDPVVLSSGMNVTPNPARDQLTLENPIEYLIHDYEIYDVIGKRVVAKRLKTRVASISIPVDHLQTGLYFLRVNFSNTSTIFRIVKD